MSRKVFLKTGFLTLKNLIQKQKTFLPMSTQASRTASKFIGPFQLEGVVTKGFGRGSKDLGIPTANFNEEVVDNLPDHLETGIYFGWTHLEGDGEKVRKAVVSIGWNPYYENSKKSVETHIIWKYEQPFYGKWLKLLICGYIRPEQNYDSLQSLIDDINMDISQASKSLEENEFKTFAQDSYFNLNLQNGHL